MTPTMKILISAADDSPPRRADVVELFFVELAKRGIECTWHLRNGLRGEPDSDTFLGQRIVVAPAVAGGGVARKLLNKVLYWFTDFPFFFLQAHKFDALQVRDKYLAAGIALLTARLTGKKAIYWCSYPFPENTLERAELDTKPWRARMRRMYARWGTWWLYRFLMPRMDHVFVQTDQMRTSLAAQGVPRDKMTPVPMGVTRALLRANDGRGDTPTTPGKVVYLGTLARTRRLELLIHAFSRVAERCSEATFWMVGDGDKPYERGSLEDLANKLGLSDRVVFTGHLPSDLALGHVRDAEVCVSPIYPSATLLQGSPTKLFEYMALAKPTVANHHPEQTLALAESGAGICVPWSEQAFADAIVELLSDRDRARAMGALGPAWIEANRTYDRLADVVFSKYKEILPAC
jgi:glycosyltransferase involved in cell wall biosynthesis